MNIVRGTFRLSLVAAIVAAGYSAFSDFSRSAKESRDHYQLVATLRCAAGFTNDRLNQYKNGSGLIDVGKLGCSERQFLATEQEIEDARAAKLDNYRSNFPVVYWQSAVGDGAVVFLAINIFGFALLGLIAIYRWIVGGFKTPY